MTFTSDQRALYQKNHEPRIRCIILAKTEVKSFGPERDQPTHCKGTKFETNIPRKGTARPQSQFPRPCVCERFIYSRDRSAYSAAEKYVD